MPLTYQPFAEVPAVRELESELRRRSPHPEGSMELLIGVLVLFISLAFRGLLRCALLLLGGWLLQRSWDPHFGRQ